MKAIIEMPRGTWFKYEADKEGKVLTLDRPLNQPCPQNYGFIPNTLCEDGDALDIFVVAMCEALAPLSRVTTHVQGVLICEDNGVADHKIIATLVPEVDADYLEELVREITEYLNTYKKGFKVLAYKGLTEANLIIDEAHKAR